MYSLMATLERAPEKISANASGKLEIDSFAASTETQVEHFRVEIDLSDEEGESV
jgi:hypothetical protein